MYHILLCILSIIYVNMSNKLTKAQLIDKISELKRKNAPRRRIQKKKPSMFMHVGLKTLAKLAVREGGANPKEVYAKHHMYNLRVGKRSKLGMKDLDTTEDDLDNDTMKDIAKEGTQDVVELDSDVPISQTVVDTLHLGTAIMPEDKQVKQLANVLSNANRVTSDGQDYNGAISCTYGDDGSDKPTIRMTPVHMDMSNFGDLGDVAGQITEGFDELKEMRKDVDSNQHTIFPNKVFDNIKPSDKTLSDEELILSPLMNGEEILRRAGGKMKIDNPLFSVESKSNVYTVGTLDIHRSMSRSAGTGMLIGQTATDKPLENKFGDFFTGTVSTIAQALPIIESVAGI